MIFVPFLVGQGFALLGLLFWWPQWSGRSTSWLEGRSGWPPMFWFLIFVFFQGAAGSVWLFIYEWPDPAPGYVSLGRLALVFFWFVGTPLAFVACFWIPRFLLPGWIKERLRAGDPAKTAWPLDEVAHLMTKRQNQRPSFEPEAEDLVLPVRIRVSRVGWWATVVVLGVFTVLLWCVVFGVPASAFENPSPMLQFLRTVSWVAAPLASVLIWFVVKAALRPEDAYLNAEGVSTRRFRLAWEEIKSVVPEGGDLTRGKGYVYLGVTSEAYEREDVKKRFYEISEPSGSTEYGGPWLYLQSGLTKPIGQVARIIEHHLNEQSPPEPVQSRPSWPPEEDLRSEESRP